MSYFRIYFGVSLALWAFGGYPFGVSLAWPFLSLEAAAMGLNWLVEYFMGVS